jgi:anti-anti-sigma regulatory factor
MLPSKPVDRVWRRFPRLLLAAALVLAAACGPSAPASSPASTPAGEPAGGKPSTPAELAVFQGSDRQQVLEVGARREGRLTWYTSLAGDIVDRLLEGYKEKYPFMQTEVFRAAENELVTRATQEAQAGQHVFDVIESQVAAIRLLYDGNLLAPYSSPGVANVPIWGERLEMLQAQALHAVEQGRAHTLVLDITGVPLVDHEVAQGLLQVVRAARLLGTIVMLVGIRPEVAETMVELGLDFQGMHTFRDLQAALDHSHHH